MIGGILAASFEPPSTKDFVYGCWGPSIKIAGFDFCFNFIILLAVLTTLIDPRGGPSRWWQSYQS